MTTKAGHLGETPAARNLIQSLAPVDVSEDSDDALIVKAVIETPQGSRNKYRYDEETGLFTLSKVLPAGFEFPFSFGFIPRSLSEDGDPLDVLVLADEPVPVGCVVPSRLIGVLEGEQSDGDEKERNDRLIAVASESNDHEDLKSFKKINPNLMKEIELFFVSYHQISGKKYKILSCRGPAGGRKVLSDAMALFKQKHRSHGNGKTAKG